MNELSRLAIGLTALVLVAMLLPACAARAPVDRIVTVSVPVPVACQEQEPARPHMDTESLAPDAAVDEQARAMRAEIDRREGYEGELRAVVRACRGTGERATK